jgi:hypothetical protein
MLEYNPSREEFYMIKSSLIKKTATMGIAATLTATLTSCHPSQQITSQEKEISKDMKEADGEKVVTYSTINVQKADGETIETDSLSIMVYQTSEKQRELLLMYLDKEEENEKYYTSITNPQVSVIQTFDEENVECQMYDMLLEQPLSENEVLYMMPCKTIESVTYDLVLEIETEENARLNEIHDEKTFQK